MCPPSQAPPKTPRNAQQQAIDNNMPIMLELLQKQYDTAKAVDTNLLAVSQELNQQAARAQADLEDIHHALSTKLADQAKQLQQLQQQLVELTSVHDQYKQEGEQEIAKLRAQLAEHAQPVEEAERHARRCELEHALLLAHSDLRNAREAHAAHVAQLERAALEERDRLQKHAQQCAAEAEARALEYGLEAHIDKTTRQALLESERLAQEVGVVRAQAQRVQAQLLKLQEENTRLKALLAVNQEAEHAIATRAAALSTALQGSLTDNASKEWQAQEARAAMADMQHRMEAVQAHGQAEQLHVLELSTALEHAQQELAAARQQVADITSQCNGVTRFLLACMEDVQQTKMGIATPSSGAGASDRDEQAPQSCLLALTPGRLEDLSPAQRSTVLQYLLDQLALYQARAAAVQQSKGVVLPCGFTAQ